MTVRATGGVKGTDVAASPVILRSVMVLEVRARVAAIAGDHRGITLIEALVATAIFAIVAVAIGSFYVSTQRAFDYGSAQAFAQRQGTMLQEELQRRLQRAVDFSVTALRIGHRDGLGPLHASGRHAVVPAPGSEGRRQLSPALRLHPQFGHPSLQWRFSL